MTSKIPNRIAQEDLENVTTWALPNVGASGKTLPSAEKEARERRQRSEEIIEDVDGDDLSFAPMTAQELQALTESAEKEGFNKGYQEGFAKGESDGRERGLEQSRLKADEVLSAQVSQLLQIAESLVEPIAEQDRALEKLLLDYVLVLTRQLLERELQTDSTHVLNAVKKAIQALPVGADNITVTVNPDDLALIETYAEERNKDWSFQADSQMLPGGCLIETAQSLVDYTIEQRLEVLSEQFRNKQLASDDDDSDESSSYHGSETDQLYPGDSGEPE